jgi:thymidine phosphorylase
MSEPAAKRAHDEGAGEVRRKTPYPRMIMQKRDGGELSPHEIHDFVADVVQGTIPMEQVGAMLMAIFNRGMTEDETIALTKELTFSGATMSWPEFKGAVVDKHSTGGVGDKISLPLAPALAACGLKVPMISGRGLGHTGGTLDKLESIPGFTISQSTEQMSAILHSVGCCIVGQTSDLVPADKKLYATRDITATVESIPLITASIVSKKVAEGLDSLILDVKVGKAAFMKTKEQALELARSMVSAGNGAGVKTMAILTAMDAPIGNAIGNAIEVAESIECLKGRGPADLTELVAEEGGHLLALNGNAATPEAGRKMILETLSNGTALAKFRDMCVAQGVAKETAAKLCEDPWSAMTQAALVTDIPAPASGFVHEIDSMALAIVSSLLGAGRQRQSDVVRHEVGIEILAHIGAAVTQGQPWLRLFHSTPLAEQDRATLVHAATIAEHAPAKSSRIIDFVFQ